MKKVERDTIKEVINDLRRLSDEFNDRTYNGVQYSQRFENLTKKLEWVLVR